MSLISKMRRQRAVYWQRSGITEEGVPTFNDPVEVACRWEDKQEEFTGPENQPMRSTAVVYPEVVASVGDMFALGTLLDFDPDPFKNATTLKVAAFEKIPNLKATENLHIAYLGGRSP